MDSVEASEANRQRDVLLFIFYYLLFTFSFSLFTFYLLRITNHRFRITHDTMEKIIRKISKAEADEEDVSYWVKKTPEERLSALAVLRQRHEGIFPKGIVRRAIRKRFRRVHRSAQ